MAVDRSTVIAPCRGYGAGSLGELLSSRAGAYAAQSGTPSEGFVGAKAGRSELFSVGYHRIAVVRECPVSTLARLSHVCWEMRSCPPGNSLSALRSIRAGNEKVAGCTIGRPCRCPPERRHQHRAGRGGPASSQAEPGADDGCVLHHGSWPTRGRQRCEGVRVSASLYLLARNIPRPSGLAGNRNLFN
jgi:hypothetical protein